MPITIVHYSDCKDGGAYDYIGRAMPRKRIGASPLANPYKIGEDGDRAAVCRLYQSDLDKTILKGSGPIYEALVDIRDRHLSGEVVRLACWCTSEENLKRPHRQCHGQNIRATVMAMPASTKVTVVTDKIIPGLGHSLVNGEWIANSKWWEK